LLLAPFRAGAADTERCGKAMLPWFRHVGEG
jgi:hypothetical protein